MSSPAETDRLDVLAIGAHPDDVELFCGGTLARLAEQGRRVGIAHLTRGECGTRGSAEIRAEEAAEAARLLGAVQTTILDLGDGRLADDDRRRRAVVELLRQARPSVVLTHLDDERHPDHAATQRLVTSAAFLAHVGGYEAGGQRHRTGAVVFFHGHERRTPPAIDWIVDISGTFPKKRAALGAYGTQFNARPGDAAPPTHISSPAFWTQIEVTARRLGALIGAEFGEAFSFREPAHRDHPFIRLFERD